MSTTALARLGGLALLFLITATKTTPTTKPATTQPATQSSSGRVWHLNEYLNGTTPQIARTLNGEVDRLTAKRNELAKTVLQQKRIVAETPKSDPTAASAA